MDSDKCKALLLAVEKGSLAEAAEALGYSVSGLSRMMQALEKETGLTLLYRSRSGVAPTPACQELLPYFRTIAEAQEHCLESAAQIKGLLRGTVHLGMLYPRCYSLLQPAFSLFARQYPGVRIEISEGSSSELAEKVSAHEIDLAIISRRPGTFTWQKLFEDPLTAWVPADDPRKVYPLKDLKKDNYIEFFAGSESDNSLILARHHIVPNIRYSAMSPSTAFAMVSAGLGVTLINHLYTGFFQGHVRELPIEPAVQMEIGIASIPREELSPAAAVFLNTLQKNL